MMRLSAYTPGTIFLSGLVASFFFSAPVPTPLETPLNEAFSGEIMAIEGTDVPIDPEEVKWSGVSSYLNRSYDIGSDEGALQLYIGYHATQQGEYRIHSPEVCLPGAGWVPVSSAIIEVEAEGTYHTINRYVLQRDTYRILVYYWFQGRGRVTAGQSTVRLNAMLDAVFSQRDEESLARIVVPIPRGRDETFPVGFTGLSPDSLAAGFAREVIPRLTAALPPAP